MFEISCHVFSKDYDMFKQAINQGIDARLEGFIKSKFIFQKNEFRMYFNFAESELSILLRRLSEMETDQANSWIDDIVYSCYGIEII